MEKDVVEQTLNEVFKPVVTPLKQLTHPKYDGEDGAVANIAVERNEPTLASEDASQPKTTISQPDTAQNMMWDSITNESNSAIENYNETIDSSMNQEADISSTELYQSLPDSSLDTSRTLEPLDTPINDTHVNKNSLIYKYLTSIGSKAWDKYYGVRQLTRHFMIGDSPIYFDDDDIITVKNKDYNASEGLLELLFMKNVNEKVITEQDKNSYQQIMLNTNGHKKNYKRHGAIRGHTSRKYKDYIRHFGQQKHSSPYVEGTGLPNTYMTARKYQAVDYVYWDDPNELVDHLRLLVASQAAGNPSHSNEIICITEELREAGIIY